MAPATKASQKRLDAAAAAFNSRYADPKQWGQDRWFQSLYPALVRPTTYSAVVNQYAVDDSECRSVLSESDHHLLSRIELPCLDKQEDSLEKPLRVNTVICYEQCKATTSDSGTTTAASTNSASAMPFPAPRSMSSSDRQLLTHWNMDAASVLAAHLLNVQPGDRVLDMCAAPGGKSVVLAQKLFLHLYKSPPSVLPPPSTLERSSLHVNEVDNARHKRLNMNLRSYLPASLFPTPESPQGAVKILNKDLSTKSSVSSLPFGANGYDRILVDAPCSSERHIIQAYVRAGTSGQIAEEMSNWKVSHVATLVKVQSGLLQTALKAIRIGGTVVYATCALGVEENDGLIERVLETLKTERKRAKRDDQPVDNWNIEFQHGVKDGKLDTSDPILLKMTESTQYGRIALPDHGGWGPLYFCVMVKVQKTKTTRGLTKTKILPTAINLVDATTDPNTVEEARINS